MKSTWIRPEVGAGFSVICWFGRLRLSRIALNLSTAIFTPYGEFPPWSGYSEFVVSSWNFCCTICCWECDFIIFCVISTSLALSLRRQTFDASKFSMSSRSAIKISPFQTLTTRSAHSREKSVVIRSCQIDELPPDLSQNRIIFNHCSKMYSLSLFEWFAKSSFVWRFPIFQEVLDISQVATAIHRIRPPPFIQS